MATRFIHIKDLHHLGTRTERVNNVLTSRNRYGSDVEIKDADVFYREGDLAGSYLFYDLFNLSCRLTSAYPLSSQDTDRQFIVLVQQQKVRNRNRIQDLRERLEHSSPRPLR